MSIMKSRQFKSFKLFSACREDASYGGWTWAARGITGGVLLTFALYLLVCGEVTHLGSFGDQQLSWPRGIALDHGGTIYVGDFLEGLDVEIFDRDRTPLGAFGGDQLARPGDIEVAPDGTILVADFDAGHVDVFDRDANHLGSFGSGQLGNPAGVTLDAAGNIFVGDINDGHVDVFDSDRQHLGRFGEGRIMNPALIAIDTDGTIYVSDRYTGHVDVFDQDFQYVDTFGEKKLIGATGIAIDRTGRIHVADLEGDKIEVFDRNFHHLETYGMPHLNGPTQLVVSETGTVYVADTLDDHVEHFFDSRAWVSGPNRLANIRVGERPLQSMPGGTVGLGGELSLAAGRTLEVAGTTTIDGHGSMVIAGDVFTTGSLELTERGARLEIRSGTLDLRAAPRLENRGQIRLFEDATLIVDTFENRGTLTLTDSSLQGDVINSDDGQLRLRGTNTVLGDAQWGGRIDTGSASDQLTALNGSVTFDSTAMLFGGGRFAGNGRFDARQATLMADEALHAVVISTTFALGNLTLEIGDAAPDTGHDQIRVDGATLSLYGTLRIGTLDGYQPSEKTPEEVVLISTLDGGTLDTRYFQGLAPGSPFRISRLDASQLAVRRAVSVPEPPCWNLFGTAWAWWLLIGSRADRRRAIRFGKWLRLASVLQHRWLVRLRS